MKVNYDYLDTFTLMPLEELLVYYLKKLEEDKKERRENEVNKDLILIDGYMEKLNLKEDTNVQRISW